MVRFPAPSSSEDAAIFEVRPAPARDEDGSVVLRQPKILTSPRDHQRGAGGGEEERGLRKLSSVGGLPSRPSPRPPGEAKSSIPRSGLPPFPPPLPIIHVTTKFIASGSHSRYVRRRPQQSASRASPVQKKISGSGDAGGNSNSNSSSCGGGGGGGGSSTEQVKWTI